MTTLESYEAVDAIYDRLDLVRRRRRTVRIATALLMLSSAAMLGGLTCGLACGYWSDQPPAALRWSLLVVIGLVAFAGLGNLIIRSLLWRQTPAQVARFVEQALPQLRNDFINTVQLSGDAQPTSRALVQEAIREAARRAESVDVLTSVPTVSVVRWGAAACLCALALLTFGLFQSSALERGLGAVLSPGAYIAPANSLELLSLKLLCGGQESGPEATFFAGEQVTIQATILNPTLNSFEGQIIIDGQADALPMISTDGKTFSCVLASVNQTLRYAVRIDNSRWPIDKQWHEITVLSRAVVASAQVIVDSPPYTQIPQRKIAELGPIQAPQGSQAMVTVRFASPVPAVLLETQGGASVAMNGAKDGSAFSAALPINADGGYRLVMRDRAGRVLQQLPEMLGQQAPPDAYSAQGQAMMEGYYPIRAVTDAPPTVEFRHPNKDVAVAPGGKLAVTLKLADDYAVENVQLFVGPDGQDAKLATDLDFTSVRGKKTSELAYTIQLPAEAKKGDVLVYYAAATDNRRLPSAGPQTAQSSRFKILVQDPHELAAELSKRHEELRLRLLAILKIQEEQCVNTAIACAADALPRVTARGKEVLAGQKLIFAGLSDLAQKFPFDAELAPMQQIIAQLANNESPLAIEQAQVLERLADLAGRDEACSLLGATQDRIIDTLQTLLAILPTLSAKTQETDATSKPGGDLTPEVREKLAQLKSDLEKFIDAQKKIVEATERLSKQPVDNYQAQQELKDLQAAQDKWEKFLNEAFTDFSKLAQQDFSNPALLKELMSVKSDITMAKDALSKKATKIATAIENNGIENATTLTANIEKWLLDKPDRERWDMEAPADGQTNIEQPPLPAELEDLVGDLLEEEEDLFDEMQDVTSKYAGSFDKGAGWGAADGPIANMNAQGVTGNQLPNNSEMSGRSGEGREGKSSGEFVEDKAVGKGGRRTPTRLSPDAFQAGQVNDQSQEAPGGATGGGKLSGAGGEGLEGPVPPPLQKELGRLAGKQASLVNRAERIRAQFRQSDFSGFNQSILLMNRVQEDLQNFRYQNALRRRDETLGSLRQASLLLTGQIDVSSDTSGAMPKYIRDDIADAMKGNLPSEYRQVLQQYYRRLSE